MNLLNAVRLLRLSFTFAIKVLLMHSLIKDYSMPALESEKCNAPNIPARVENQSMLIACFIFFFFGVTLLSTEVILCSINNMFRLAFFCPCCRRRSMRAVHHTCCLAANNPAIVLINQKMISTVFLFTSYAKTWLFLE